MKSKTILIFSEDFPPYSGGIAQWAFGMANSLSRLGHNVKIYTRYRKEFEIQPSSQNYPVCFIEGENWKKLRTYYAHRTVRQYFDSGEKADLIIATTWNIGRGIYKVAKRMSVPLITVAHGLEVTRKMPFLKKLWLKKTLKQSSLTIAVSHFTYQFIIEKLGLPENKCEVFPNGVDIKQYCPLKDTGKIKRRHQLENEKIILSLARVIKRKGHDKVIEALPKVIEKVKDVKYIICGPWEEQFYKELRVLIDRLDLNEQVVFTGYVNAEDLRLYYNACDVYIMPSRELYDKGDTEGFGITYLEANACEKPVIGGRSGGVTDAIVDGETGFLVNPASVDEIAGKLILLLQDHSLAQKLGKQGRKRIEKEFTWDIIADKLCRRIFKNI
ncbi:MAG: glycosyltransferase family 4 protein [Calditrichales bacterium]|nr:glycosyltransferase family 4 protein [Calditrichales bacterium]